MFEFSRELVIVKLFGGFAFKESLKNRCGSSLLLVSYCFCCVFVVSCCAVVVVAVVVVVCFIFVVVRCCFLLCCGHFWNTQQTRNCNVFICVMLRRATQLIRIQTYFFTCFCLFLLFFIRNTVSTCFCCLNSAEPGHELSIASRWPDRCAGGCGGVVVVAVVVVHCC